MPTEPGVGIVPPLTSAVRRPEPLAEIIRRKLMPNLEQVTWRDPTVSHANSISNLVAAGPYCHEALNLFDNLRGKFDASAPTGRAGISHRHGCTFGVPPVPVLVVVGRSIRASSARLASPVSSTRLSYVGYYYVIGPH
jgi:hypothetical protein